MRTSSAKAKGRRLQQNVAQLLRDATGLTESDIRSISMGAQGCDVMLSAEARKHIPFAIECKNQEKISIWASWEQTKDNAELEKLQPLLVFSKNHSEVLVTMTFGSFLELLRERNTTK